MWHLARLDRMRVSQAGGTMKLGDDVSKRMILLKGFLFLVILMTARSVLLVQASSLQRVFLLGVVIWSSARLYYFMFYVIEKYVDANFRFSSVYAFICYLLKKGKQDSP
ncbi:MAG: hypothetical protein ACI9QL_004237 [Candidatus Omnitrophota bacterium]|jgi:hypothetical protein